jgi:hypothetical protein
VAFVAPELIVFLHAHVETLSQLELLLLLREARGDVTEERAATALYISEDAARADLQVMQGVGLAVRGRTGWRLIDDPKQVAAIDRLSEAYREGRAAVIEEIYKKPSKALRNFAEAFVVRRKP